MYIVKNALLSIRRNRGRNILLCIIIIVIASASTITLAIRNSANKIVEAYENKYNIEATLEVNRDAIMSKMESGTDSMESNIEKWNSIVTPTLEEINNYGDSEYIDYYYYTVQVGMNASDITSASSSIKKTTTETTITEKYNIGGTPSPSQNGGPSSNGGTRETTTKTRQELIQTNNLNGDFTLVGYSSIEGMSDFISGNYTISEGEIDTDFDNNSCVISSELASLNEINVGDTIKLQNADDTNLTYELIVTGIYEDNQDSSNSLDKMFSDSANKIITNVNVVNQVISDDEDINTTITPTYILKDKDVASAFALEVSEKGLSEYYEVNNNIDEIEAETDSISNVSSFATTFLIITLIIGGVVLLIINMINVRERKYEIGVLRTIGMKKRLVITQFVFELMCVSLIGLMIGFSIGAVSSVNVANKLMANEIESSKENIKNMEGNFGKNVPEKTDEIDSDNNDSIPDKVSGIAVVSEVSTINAVVDYKVLLELLGIGLALTCISSLSAMISIANFRPLTILKERS